MKKTRSSSKSKLVFWNVMVMVLFLFGHNSIIMAQGPNRVRVVSPKQGEEVGSAGTVQGTSEINDDSHVWVLTHRRDLTNQWWPQDKPGVSENEWFTNVYYGQPVDKGYDFEIAVATFKGEEEKKILKYHEIGKKFGKYLPIPFPKATSNIEYVIVKKKSH
jgi:hypothetical protein